MPVQGLFKWLTPTYIPYKSLGARTMLLNTCIDGYENGNKFDGKDK